MIAIDDRTFAYPRGEFRPSIPKLRVAAGERLAVIGPSGSGKTTLLNLVSAIFTPERGEVRVATTPVSALSDTQRHHFRIRNVGFMFEDFELLDYLNVLCHILHPYNITRVLRLESQVRARAVLLAEQVGPRPGVRLARWQVRPRRIDGRRGLKRGTCNLSSLTMCRPLSCEPGSVDHRRPLSWRVPRAEQLQRLTGVIAQTVARVYP